MASYARTIEMTEKALPKPGGHFAFQAVLAREALRNMYRKTLVPRRPWRPSEVMLTEGVRLAQRRRAASRIRDPSAS